MLLRSFLPIVYWLLPHVVYTGIVLSEPSTMGIHFCTVTLSGTVMSVWVEVHLSSRFLRSFSFDPSCCANFGCACLD